MIIYILAFFYVSLLYGQSSSDQYGYFTPERQSILVQMGRLFERTVRENFPAGTDSLSYMHFFECIRQNMSMNKAPFVLYVDRHELQAINQRLFKDENYYFFYKKYVIVPENELLKIHQDSVPVKRTSAPASTGILLLAPILNKDGYIREVTEWNRVVLSAQYLMRAFGDIGMTVFVEGVLHDGLREISAPAARELCAVLFWRHLCYCGGVDLVNRKCFCEPCHPRQGETPEITPREK
jgi:hypothetical protein